jgi:hypothetical protein
MELNMWMKLAWSGIGGMDKSDELDYFEVDVMFYLIKWIED